MKRRVRGGKWNQHCTLYGKKKEEVIYDSIDEIIKISEILW